MEKSELKQLLRNLKSPDPLTREHAVWALKSAVQQGQADLGPMLVPLSDVVSSEESAFARDAAVLALQHGVANGTEISGTLPTLVRALFAEEGVNRRNVFTTLMHLLTTQENAHRVLGAMQKACFSLAPTALSSNAHAQKIIQRCERLLSSRKITPGSATSPTRLSPIPEAMP